LVLEGGALIQKQKFVWVLHVFYHRDEVTEGTEDIWTTNIRKYIWLKPDVLDSFLT
jgi:hypothetical protein